MTTFTRVLICSLALAGPPASFALVPDAPPKVAPLEVKVLIVNMFQLEAAPWIEALKPDRQIAVPGLAENYPSVRCNADAVCQMTTGMGHASAAASMMAMLYSGKFDFRQTYFIIAGIAGIDPARGTIGTAAWARFAVDVGIAHEIDARELPDGWQDGYFGVMTDSPDVVPKLDYRSEVFKLDESLLQRAYALSKSAALEDSDDVRAYRKHYPSAPANLPPQVTICDTATSDTWWVGERLGDHARHWLKLLTQGAGDYCTTQQEDNATLTALSRASHSGLVDMQRVALLRSGSDFDRPYPRQMVLEGLRTQLQIKGTIRISTRNLVVTGMPLVDDIVHHWELWKYGVPAAAAP
jgi:purine nucleoside permease